MKRKNLTHLLLLTVQLADLSNRSELATMRAQLRTHLLNSPLLDGPSHAKAFSDVLLEECARGKNNNGNNFD